MLRDDRASHFQFVKEIASYERQALQLLAPVTVATMVPRVVFVTTPAQSKVWDYWRVALSSATQSASINNGRTQRLFVFDETGGGLLGVTAITGIPQYDQWMDHYFQWTDKNLDSKHGVQNAQKFAVLHQVLMLRRCLPVYEFGSELLGGKLLASLMVTKEIIRKLELQYSFSCAVMLAHTLNGKSSLYNRLKDWDRADDSGSEDGAAHYICNLRKHGTEYLRGQKDALGPLRVPGYAEQAQYFRERWLEPRAESKNITTLTFDHDRYRVDNLLRTIDCN